MGKGRLEAFSDGVLAIIITIMVLELKVPHGDSMQDLLPLGRHFAFYAMSFVFVGIYWNNHHHLLHSMRKVTGPIMWANLHLLFWISIIPFTTEWLGETHFEAYPTAAYGCVLFLAGGAFRLLVAAGAASEGPNSVFVTTVGNDIKGNVSMAAYALGIGLSFVRSWMGIACYVAVALMWLVPDKRFERIAQIATDSHEHTP